MTTIVNDYECEVRIDGAKIVVSYDDGGPVTYEGEAISPGHFRLACPRKKGRATLHRAPDDNVLEGIGLKMATTVCGASSSENNRWGWARGFGPALVNSREVEMTAALRQSASRNRFLMAADVNALAALLLQLNQQLGSIFSGHN